MSAQACMGGHCARRDLCGHYHAASETQEPVERLCSRGRDGDAQKESADMTRIRFSNATRMEQIAAVLAPGGVTTAAIAHALAIKGSSWISVVMAKAVKMGVAFRGLARVSDGMRAPETIYFPTAESRDVFMVAYRKSQKEKRQAYWRDKAFKRQGRDRSAEIAKRSAKRAEAVEQREANAVARAIERRSIAIGEREQAKQRARLDREAKTAAKQREKAEAKSQQVRLKAETKADSKMPLPKGTASVTAAKPRGPAHLAGPADESRARVTKLETPPDRYAAATAPSVISSSECRSWAKELAHA